MKSSICLLLLVLMCATDVSAQRPAALVRKGDAAMQVSDYYTALHYFRQALAARPAPDIRFRLAEAAFQFKAYELAAEQYELLVEGSAAAQFPGTQLGLGLTYGCLGQYDAAVRTLDTFLQLGRGTRQQVNTATQAMASCRWALTQPADDTWKSERLPRRINSAYGEFGAWKSGDTLYFTSYRFEREKDSYDPPRKVSKVMFSTDDKRGRLLGRGFNADTLLTAHTAISTNGKQLFFNHCQYVAGAQIRCDLCVRGTDRRGRWESGFQKLPAPVNLPEYTNTQPAILRDTASQQEYLLFVSNRPGGAGSFDLWQVPIPADLKKWEAPQPLAALNSAAAEVSPFFSFEQQRLYFSTDAAPGFGGFDLVGVPYTGNGNWGPAENLGPGLNTSYDETYPFFENEDVLYFSSNRPGGTYLDPDTKNCCSDIFKAERLDPIPSPPPAFTQTEIPIPVPAAIPPVKSLPRTLEEFLPLMLFYDNDQPDPATRKTTTRRTYEETYFNYLKREENYYAQFTDEEEVQDAIAAFFESEVVAGYESLERFSSILLEQLAAGQTVEIFLKGYTSPRAQGDYNLLLGKRRVSAVRNHFTGWRAGILQRYLQEGKLIISEVSFGETQAAAPAQDERAGERLSIYSPAAARERRVEIVEVKRGNR